MTAEPNATASTSDFEFAALSEAKNYRAALLHDFASHLYGNVLEVGSGTGQITAELRRIPQIQKLLSIEPEPSFCAYTRAQLPGLELIQGTIEDVKSDGRWNAILSINVLEHIEDDGMELAAYHRLLTKEKGALCLFVPARPEIYAPIDRDFGHFRRYTRLDLQRKLKRAGFRVGQLKYYNSVGYLAWWLNFCFLKRRAFDIASVRFFDRAIFPLVHGFESRICAPPIGQSLMGVAIAD